MAAVPLRDAQVGTDTVTLLVAAERAASSFLKAMENGSAAALELPAIRA
jgi:hypothetical protein